MCPNKQGYEAPATGGRLIFLMKGTTYLVLLK